MVDNAVVGTITSAGYGHRVSENLAMGFVEPTYADEGTAVDVLVLGRRINARVVPECRYDPNYELVRS